MALGYAAPVHRRAARAAQKRFFQHTRAANAAAQRGACSTAVKELAHAASWHGVAVAERLDSGPKKGFGPTMKPFIALQKAVTRGCSCKRR
jgi:hypothetical protein